MTWLGLDGWMLIQSVHGWFMVSLLFDDFPKWLWGEKKQQQQKKTSRPSIRPSTFRCFFFVLFAWRKMKNSSFHSFMMMMVMIIFTTIVNLGIQFSVVHTKQKQQNLVFTFFSSFSHTYFLGDLVIIIIIIKYDELVLFYLAIFFFFLGNVSDWSTDQQTNLTDPTVTMNFPKKKKSLNFDIFFKIN